MTRFDFCLYQGWFVDLHHKVASCIGLCGGEDSGKKGLCIQEVEILDDVQRGIRQNDVAGLAGFTQWNGQDACSVFRQSQRE